MCIYMYIHIIFIYIFMYLCIYVREFAYTFLYIYARMGSAQIGTGQTIADWAQEDKIREMDRIVRHVCVLHTQSVVHFAQPKSEANNRHV